MEMKILEYGEEIYTQIYDYEFPIFNKFSTPDCTKEDLVESLNNLKELFKVYKRDIIRGYRSYKGNTPARRCGTHCYINMQINHKVIHKYLCKHQKEIKKTFGKNNITYHDLNSKKRFNIFLLENINTHFNELLELLWGLVLFDRELKITNPEFFIECKEAQKKKYLQKRMCYHLDDEDFVNYFDTHAY